MSDDREYEDDGLPSNIVKELRALNPMAVLSPLPDGQEYKFQTLSNGLIAVVKGPIEP